MRALLGLLLVGRLLPLGAAAPALRPGFQDLREDPRFLQAMRSYADQPEAAVAEMKALCEEAPADGMRWVVVTAFLVNRSMDAARGLPFAQKAYELLPEMPETHIALGFAHLQVDEPAKAETVLEKALAKFPEDASVMYSYASACGMNRKLIEAQHWFEEAVKRQPDHALYLFAAGENCLKLHRYKEAEEYFRGSHRSKSRHPDAGWKLAQVLGLQQKDEPAEKLFRNALEKAPARSRLAAGFQYAVFLFERQRLAEAEPLLQDVVEKDPSHRLAWHYLARCLGGLGRKEASRAALERYRALQKEEDRKEEEYLLGLIREQLAGDADR